MGTYEFLYYAKGIGERIQVKEYCHQEYGREPGKA